MSRITPKDLNTLVDVYPLHQPLPVGEKEGPHAPPVARKLEIFLDYMALNSTSVTKHLLDSSFKDVLNEGELELSTRMADLLSQASPLAKSTPAYKKLRDYIHENFGQPYSTGKQAALIGLDAIQRKQKMVVAQEIKLKTSAQDMSHLKEILEKKANTISKKEEEQEKEEKGKEEKEKEEQKEEDKD